MLKILIALLILIVFLSCCASQEQALPSPNRTLNESFPEAVKYIPKDEIKSTISNLTKKYYPSLNSSFKQLAKCTETTANLNPSFCQTDFWDYYIADSLSLYDSSKKISYGSIVLKIYENSQPSLPKYLSYYNQFPSYKIETQVINGKSTGVVTMEIKDDSGRTVQTHRDFIITCTPDYIITFGVSLTNTHANNTRMLNSIIDACK